MNQICTNKEQSSRLLEAGVRPETADCYLQRITETDDWSNNNVLDEIIESWMNKQVLLDMDGRYPAWSLSKLIDMMPPAIDGLGTLYLCAGLNTKKYNADNKVKDHLYSIEYGVNYTSHRYDDPIEALIETIEWLIKEGHLDKKFLSVKCGDCKLIEDEDASGDAWCSLHQKPVRCDSEACKDILEKGGNDDHT